jgi:superoxide dismutase, Cu-Zn family
MMNKLLWLLVSVLFLAFVVLLPYGTDANARAGLANVVIEGIVVDSSDIGIPGVTVTIWRRPSGRVFIAQTEKDGTYRFELDRGDAFDVNYAHSALGFASVSHLSGNQSHRICPVILLDTTKMGLVTAHAELQSIENLALLALTNSDNMPPVVMEVLKGQTIMDRVSALGKLEPTSPHSRFVVGARSSLTLAILNSYRRGLSTPAPSRQEFSTTGATKAIAQMTPTSESSVRGTVTFTKQASGIHVHAELSGLLPGEHGFHIHEFGVWSQDGMAAGAHFNPTMAPHAGRDSARRHFGDLGNITANANGSATLDIEDMQITFQGATSILGRGVVVHEKADDLKSQPAGNAGARLAVGIIGIARP